MKWDETHGGKGENPWSLNNIAKIKREFDTDQDRTRTKYKELFYYYDGLIDTKVSQSVHPAGMVISPISLDDNYGVFDKDNENCLMLDMDEAHEVGLAKYDFLILKTVQVIRDTCAYLNRPYPKTHEINWFDDAVYSILQSLQSQEATAKYADEITVAQLNDFFDTSDSLARHTVEDYKLCVDNVIDAAFRRDALQSLKKFEAMCFNESIKDIEQQIYRSLDDVMMEFSATTEVPAYKDVIDECWAEIEGRQGSGYAGIPFKFPALNDYATIERGELFIFGAEQKQGKSMMLLNM